MSELPGVLSAAVNNEAGLFSLSAETQSLLFYVLDLGTNYRNWLHDRLDEVSDADKAQIDDLIEFATYEVMNVITLPYPTKVHIETLAGIKLSGTTLSKTLNTSQFYNHMIEVTPSALNNMILWPFYAKKGQYDFHVLGARGTNYAQVQAQILGGSSSAAQDWYNATAANNIEYIYHLSVPTDGDNYIQILCPSKNASSTGYRWLVSNIYAERTGDL